MSNRVVAHFLDGRVAKGVSLDVDASRPRCHIRTSDGQTLEVRLTDLKALFFVKSLDGNPARQDSTQVSPDDDRTAGTFSIEVEFADGERVVGLTVRYPPIKPFFFILPVDPASNNIRILVNKAAVTKMSRPWETTSA
jgi:hypothetical protein